MNVWGRSALLSALLLSQAVANDDFADRVAFAGNLPITISSTHVGATGGGIHETKPSRWWTWTAPDSGWHEIQIDSDAPLTVAIYQGIHLNRLRTVSESFPPAEGDPTTLPFLATAGESYEFAILGTTVHDPGPFNLTLKRIPSPTPNDHFENSIDLGEALDVTILAQNYGATAENGEPNHDNSQPQSSVWWKFSPTETRIYKFKPLNATPCYSPRLNIYEGTSLGNLSYVYQPPNFSSLWNDYGARHFVAEAGKVYHLMMDRPAKFGAGDGQLKVKVEALPERSNAPPANDNFSEAFDLGTTANTSFLATFAGATRENGELIEILGSQWQYTQMQKTSWWKWECPQSGLYGIISLSRYNVFNDYFKIARENPDGGLEEISFRPLRNQVFEAMAGEKYYFMSGTLSETKTDPINFQFQKLTPSLNRTNASAIHVGRTDEFKVSGENLTGTTSFIPALKWLWEPLSGGNYRFEANSLSAGSLDLTLSEVQANGETIPINRNSRGGNYYPARAGATYLISMQSNPRSILSLKTSLLPPSSNDLFENALDLGITHYVRSQSNNYGAVMEPGEPQSVLTTSIWWKWQAPETGPWQFTADKRAYLDIFQGSSIDNLQSLTNPLRGSVSFVATQGEEYFIRVNPYDEGEQTLVVSKGSPTLNNFRSQALDLGNQLFAEARGGYTQATAEPDEPGSRNLWWIWTAPTSGLFSLTPRYFENVTIYQGDPAGEFSDLRPVDSAILGESKRVLVFKTEPGEQYLIASYQDDSIDRSESGQLGHLILAPFIAPPGDFFEDRIDLGGASFVEYLGAGNNATISPTDPSPCSYCVGTIWMTWTPPATGRYEITGQSLRGDGDDDWIGVYSGNSSDNLTQLGIAHEDDSEVPTFTFQGTKDIPCQIVFFSDENFETFEIRISALHSYEYWMRGWQDFYHVFLAASPLSDLEISREGNPKRDGIPNFTKYVFGLNPIIPQGTDYNLRNLPAFTVTPENLELKYRLGASAFYADAIRIDHFGEWSSDGVSWERIEPTSLGNRWFVARTPIDESKKLLRVRAVED